MGLWGFGRVDGMGGGVLGCMLYVGLVYRVGCICDGQSRASKM
jgi:hypothetical protein